METFKLFNEDLLGKMQVFVVCTDLNRSIAFYRNTLGAKLKSESENGAYFTLGNLSLCLKLASKVTLRDRDTLLVFSCTESTFDYTANHIAETAKQWKTEDSIGKSLFFLDPDGHKFELHASDVHSCLKTCEQNRPKGLHFYH